MTAWRRQWRRHVRQRRTKRSMAGVPQWRSGYERRLREHLDRAEVLYDYEKHVFPITLDVPGHYCDECRSRKIRRVTRYTPDFFIRSTELFVEAKGKFDARARKLALAFTAQYPDKRYAMIFQRDNWLSSKKTQRYSDWCKKHEILYAVGNKIPEEWYNEGASGLRVLGDRT